MKSGDRIRVALIGYGLGGAAFHAPLIALTPAMRLSFIVTSNPERAAQARQRHPEAAIVDSAARLWERAGEIDLVVISTPNVTHVPLGLAALHAGLPVVVDKPLAATADDGLRLLTEALRRGLLLSVFQNRRWDGDFLTVRKLIAEGALGEVHRFESRFERWRPRPKPGWRETDDPAEGGGTLLDLGPHLVDQALQLFGPPVRMHAEVHTRRPGAEADDDAFLALEHEGGAVSHLWMSAVAAAPGPRFRVLGSRAAYVKRGLDGQEDALRAGGDPAAPDWGQEPPEAWGELQAGDERRPVRTEAGAYPRFYAELRDALAGAAPLPVDPADAVAALALLEEAAAS